MLRCHIPGRDFRVTQVDIWQINSGPLSAAVPAKAAVGQKSSQCRVVRSHRKQFSLTRRLFAKNMFISCCFLTVINLRLFLLKIVSFPDVQRLRVATVVNMSYF